MSNRHRPLTVAARRRTLAAARSLAVAGALAAAGACSSSPTNSPPMPDAAAAPVVDLAAHDASPLIAKRPYLFRAPAGVDPLKPSPLVIALHGYGGNGADFDAYFRLGKLVDSKGFLYAYPTGTTDRTGSNYWNATNACCSFYGGDDPADDVAYLNAIIDDVSSRYVVDQKRIFVVGHSNGGFMSHRFACEASNRVAAIVSLAGAQWKDPSNCTPTSKVSVLQVHGTNDDTIHYPGGHIGDTQGVKNGPVYPGARETVGIWAMKDGCTGALAPTGKTYHIDTTLPDPDATEETYGGCPAGIAVSLWTVKDGPHSPHLVPSWNELVWGFLSAHPKP